MSFLLHKVKTNVKKPHLFSNNLHIERFLNKSSGRLNITSFYFDFFSPFFFYKINQNKEESLGKITTTTI